MAGIVDIEAAKARLAELDAERQPLVALIQAAEAYEGVVGKSLFERGTITVRQRPKQLSGRSAPVLEATEKAVAELLELMGPCPTAMLATILRDKPELNLKVENVNNVLSARLSNSAKFVGDRTKGWWFADRPPPAQPVAAPPAASASPPTPWPQSGAAVASLNPWSKPS